MRVRFKVSPPVRDVEYLREIAAALPLVPGSVEDCCSRIRDRTAVPSRDAARAWLTFCQALGLANETDRGFHRVREEPERETVAANFRERVFGVTEILAAIDSGGTLDDAVGAVREEVPTWERGRTEDWEANWRERTERLLGWAVELGLARVENDRYSPRDP